MSDFESASDQRTDNNTVRHNYRVLNEQEKADMVEIKDAGLAFIKTLDRFPSSRELSLAKTKVEEAVMWAVKHVTR
jgi:DNA-binding transcriptional regulator YhcF (GntR family)